MLVRLADTRRSKCTEDDVPTLAQLTGKSEPVVRRRLAAAHGNTLVRRIFSSEWPVRGEQLTRLSVELARTAVLHVEVAEASGLRLPVVRTRLNGSSPKSQLAQVFPELGNPLRDRRKELKSNNRMTFKNWGRYSRSTVKYSVVELLGDARTTSIRDAPIVVNWLATVLGLERRSVQQMLRAWHGHGNIRRVFARHWPAAVTFVPAAVVKTLSAGATLKSPSLVRLVSDVSRVSPNETFRRITAAPRRAHMADVFPELSKAA